MRRRTEEWWDRKKRETGTKTKKKEGEREKRTYASALKYVKVATKAAQLPTATCRPPAVART